MITTTQSRPKVGAETDQPTTVPEPTLREQIDAVIAEAVRNAPPSLSIEEQKKKNQAAIEMLDQWDEEDKTDDPKEIARRVAEWEEFKRGMNEHHSSNRIIYP